MTDYRVTSPAFDGGVYVLLTDLKKSGDDFLLDDVDVARLLEKWQTSREMSEIRMTAEGTRSVAVYYSGGVGDSLELWERKEPSRIWFADECPFELTIELDDPPRERMVTFLEVVSTRYTGTLSLTNAQVDTLLTSRTLDVEYDHLSNDIVDTALNSISVAPADKS